MLGPSHSLCTASENAAPCASAKSKQDWVGLAKVMLRALESGQGPPQKKILHVTLRRAHTGSQLRQNEQSIVLVGEIQTVKANGKPEWDIARI